MMSKELSDWYCGATVYKFYLEHEYSYMKVLAGLQLTGDVPVLNQGPRIIYTSSFFYISNRENWKQKY